VHALLERRPTLKFSISYTTRTPRQTETHGEDYYFVSEEEFVEIRSRDAFLEYAEVFGNWYGTSEDYVQLLLDQGHSVLLEIDWQGASLVRERRRDAITVFILPPSRDELERRLRGRQTDSEEVIRRRLSQALEDMAHWDEFDYVVINEDLDVAAEELAAIVAGGGAYNRADAEESKRRVAGILSDSTD
jgi:guanylate kinase